MHQTGKHTGIVNHDQSFSAAANGSVDTRSNGFCHKGTEQQQRGMYKKKKKKKEPQTKKKKKSTKKPQTRIPAHVENVETKHFGQYENKSHRKMKCIDQ